LTRQRIQKWGGIGVAVVAVAILTGASSDERTGFTGGEVLTLCGFLLTCAAILWRGGRLEGVLNRLERDVANLSDGKKDFDVFRRQSESDRATLHTRVEDIERRVGAVEETCRVVRKEGHS